MLQCISLKPRCMKVELCHLCTDLDFGNVCPACSKVSLVYNAVHIIINGDIHRNLEVWSFLWMLSLVYHGKRPTGHAKFDKENCVSVTSAGVALGS